MKHRIYTKPFTRINENWNTYGELNTLPTDEKYSDNIITGSANGHHINRHNDIVKDFYQLIGIDIVTETVFDYKYPRISEKIIRPIINKRPFLVVGAPNTLKFLCSKGFQTFAPFINEDYDQIVDPVYRMKFLLDEITRLTQMPIDKIKDFVLEYTPILNHNFNILKDLEQQELKSISKLLSKL